MSRRLDLDAAADLTRRAILDAVRSRATGRVSVLLSGGRDSGTVASALGHAGVAADCLTFQVPSGLGSDETGSARTLAIESGHRWRAIPISASINDEDLKVLPTLNGPGRPCSRTRSPRWAPLPDHLPEWRWRGSAANRCSVGLIAYRKCRASGVLAAVTDAARTSHRDWTFSYTTQAKWLVPAPFPRACWRPVKPMARHPLGGHPFRIPTPVCACSLIARLPPRCAHRAWAFGDRRATERVLQRVSTAYVAPLLDLGSFRSPCHCRIICGRPSGGEAGPRPRFLGPRARTRMKGRYVGIVDALAEEEVRLFPGLRRTGRLLAKLGSFPSRFLPRRMWPSGRVRCYGCCRSSCGCGGGRMATDTGTV